ncbi:MAG: hypothetical protein QNI95_08670 [Desulfobacterales bacterium]|nr:hypothetical protein [Desulfobacterales bacterium]
MSKKQEFQDRIESQLKEWGSKIDELKSRAAGVTDDAKGKYEELIQGAGDRKQKVIDKLHHLKKSSDEAWVDIKVGVENAMDELKDAVHKVKEDFKQ